MIENDTKWCHMTQPLHDIVTFEAFGLWRIRGCGSVAESIWAIWYVPQPTTCTSLSADRSAPRRYPDNFSVPSDACNTTSSFWAAVTHPAVTSQSAVTPHSEVTPQQVVTLHSAVTPHSEVNISFCTNISFCSFTSLLFCTSFCSETLFSFHSNTSFSSSISATPHSVVTPHSTVKPHCESCQL